MWACVDHEGNGYPSVRAMCAHWGVSTQTYQKRLARGASLAEALDPKRPAVLSGPATDPDGKVHRDFDAMCRAWGCSPSAVGNRLSHGWDLRDALDDSQWDAGVPVDHEGNVYPSMRAMCRHWGVRVTTYVDRRTRGWTVEQALCGKPDGERRVGKGVLDLDGTWFPSVRALCDSHGMDYSLVAGRLANGWTLKRALDPDRYVYGRVKDHLGNEFPSQAAMCRAWGVDAMAYYKRRERGWTVEQSLTAGSEDGGAAPLMSCEDHLGNRFPNVNAMCRHWGVSRACFVKRIDLGWDLERALTEPTHGRERACVDHLGNEFPSVKAMCERWGVGDCTYRARLKSGWTLEEALAGRAGGGER